LPILVAGLVVSAHDGLGQPKPGRFELLYLLPRTANLLALFAHADTSSPRSSTARLRRRRCSSRSMSSICFVASALCELRNSRRVRKRPSWITSSRRLTSSPFTRHPAVSESEYPDRRATARTRPPR